MLHPSRLRHCPPPVCVCVYASRVLHARGESCSNESKRFVCSPSGPRTGFRAGSKLALSPQVVLFNDWLMTRGLRSLFSTEGWLELGGLVLLPHWRLGRGRWWCRLVAISGSFSYSVDWVGVVGCVNYRLYRLFFSLSHTRLRTRLRSL